MSKSALGRGLGALLGGMTPAPKGPAVPPQAATPARPTVQSPSPFAAPPPAKPVPPSNPAPATQPSGEIRSLGLDQIQPCPLQPRKAFAEGALDELAASIREQGVVQPLIVRPAPVGTHFELIAGERRWRAARKAGLTRVPVVVRPASDLEVLELALIENLQRENLNPVEEALGYSQLIAQFGLKQEEVALKVGRNRVTVANSLRLLKLPEDVRNLVAEGRLSAGHAKALLSLPTAQAQSQTAARVIKDGLSVRETEALVQHPEPAATTPVAGHERRVAGPGDPHLTDLTRRLEQRLATKVHLKYRAGKGSLEIRFFNDDDLERVLEILGIKPD